MLMKTLVSLAFITLTLTNCTTGVKGILSKRTPHETYGQKLKDAGLDQSELGRQWFSLSNFALTNPIQIQLPYKETGYFSAEKPGANAFLFNVKRGEKITATLIGKSIGTADIYFELWEKETSGQAKFITVPEANTNEINFSVKSNSSYVIRIQPELLKSIEYTLTVTTGPSLTYPVGAKGNDHIKSVFGVARDGGARKHEGIDMFAPMRTPLLAVADGYINRVQETPIGGKVIWLRPDDQDFSVYYAHLDKQLVNNGQRVKSGDTIGLMGKTGNAASTAPHLHFGIYTSSGAIDPYHFVYKNNQQPPEITAQLNYIGKRARVNSKASFYSRLPEEKPYTKIKENSLVYVEGAYKDRLRVKLIDGTVAYLPSSSLSVVEKPIRQLTSKTDKVIYESPLNGSLTIRTIKAGTNVDLLAEADGYYYVRNQDIEGWIIN